MIIQLPPKNSRRWTGPYLGNYYGTLWKTFNVDLDREEGKIGLSRRLDTVADTSTLTDSELGVISAFIRANSDCTDRYWALSDSGSLYRVDSSPTGTWALDTLANSPTRGHDMAIFENDTRGDSVSRQQIGRAHV